jgi:tripeptidyl-peptidase I
LLLGIFFCLLVFPLPLYYFYRVVLSHFTVMAAASKLLSLGAAALVYGLAAQAAVLKDQIANVPMGWSKTGTPSGDSQVVLQIALAQQNLDQLESKLASVSTPDSPSYGEYMTSDEVNAMFGASDESFSAVQSWLKSSGVSNAVTQGNTIWFQTTVSNANAMFGTTFHSFENAKGETKVRTTEYSVPEEVAAHVDLVAPTTFFGKTTAMRAKPGAVKASTKPRLPRRNAVSQSKPLVKRQVPAACNQTLTYENRTFASFGPECLKIEYNVTGYKPDPKSGSKVAFGSFLNQSASFSDFALFEEYYHIPTQK